MTQFSLRYKVCYGVLSALLVLSYLLVFAPLNVAASAHSNAQNKLPGKALHTSAPQSGHITVIVLDMSGSMNTNDPQGLRCSAANAYIDLSGENDFVGAVGLDNKGDTRGGYNNFETAIPWFEPRSTATEALRKSIRDDIVGNSNNCKPDNNTPTYDSLQTAYTMLDKATKEHNLTGSVILLTDGAPAPNALEQIDAIKNKLVPQFKSRSWPIDTIALGVNDTVAGANFTFHDFLKDVANGTSGGFYDDGNGEVQGVSALNIAPFFVKIFATRVGRTPNQSVPPTTLNGTIVRKNFNVDDLTNSLDVVVVKDQSDTAIKLVTPGGQVIDKSGSGVIVSNDPHYKIFSIQQPQPGQWEVNVLGSGQFLLKSLKVSAIGVKVVNLALKGSTIPASSVLPLGQPIVITAALTSSGQVVSDRNYSLEGSILYEGGSSLSSRKFTMSNNGGNYTGEVIVPITEVSGSYDIVVSVKGASGEDVIANDTRSVRLALFPIPKLLSAKTAQPTNDVVDATALQWSWPLQLLYSIPVVDRLAAWPLQGHPAQPYIDVAGVVQSPQGKPYPDAKIQATARANNTNTDIPVTITQDSKGSFRLQFVPPTTNTYKITFQTKGSYKDTQGDFGATQQTLNVTVSLASFPQNLFAGGITVFYMFLLYFLYLLIRFFGTPGPDGKWVRKQNGDEVGSRKFSSVVRSPLAAFLNRDVILSQQVKMPPGLQLRFRRGGAIDIRATSAGRKNWETNDGGRIGENYQHATELTYRVGGSDESQDGDYYDDAEAGISQFSLLSTRTRQATPSSPDYDERRSTRSPKDSKRRRTESTNAYDNDAWEQPRSKSSRKPSRKGRSASWEDEY